MLEMFEDIEQPCGTSPKAEVDTGMLLYHDMCLG